MSDLDIEALRATDARMCEPQPPQQRRRGAAEQRDDRGDDRLSAARGADRRLRGRGGGRGSDRRHLRALAELVGALPSQIALFDNSTHAWNAACYSVPLQAGDRILTGRNEYGSAVLAYLQLAQRTGAEVVVVPDDDAGQIDVAALADLIDERTRLIGLTWVPTAGGLVNPAADVGRLARAADVLVPSGRHPGRRPVPDRRLGRRLRHAHRHRTQVPARPARHGFPLCRAEGARSARPVRRRDPFRHLGRRAFLHMGGRRAAASRRGRTATSTSSASAPRCARPSTSALTAIGRRSRRTRCTAAHRSRRDRRREGARSGPRAVRDRHCPSGRRATAEVADALSRRGINVSTTVAEHNQFDSEAATSTRWCGCRRTTTTPRRRSTRQSTR